MEKICVDLQDEYQALDDLVATLDAKTWFRQTQFYDWTIFDQLAHIALIDHEALLAIDDPVRFSVRMRGVVQMIVSDERGCHRTREMLGVDAPEQLLNMWRTIRATLVDRLRRMDPGMRIRWYGPEMSARSFATARLMETWAHGQDVYDTLAMERENTDRLRHVAHLGVATFPWSFMVRDLPPPDATPRVELTGPSGALWTWGPADGHERLWGSAEDFCLVVTQRRHLADTKLQCQGTHVHRWMTIAQAFAGIAQDPPVPGARANRPKESDIRSVAR